MYSNRMVGLSLGERYLLQRRVQAILLITLVAPAMISAISVNALYVSEQFAVLEVAVVDGVTAVTSYVIVLATPTASIKMANAGLSAYGGMMGIISMIVIIYALETFFNATGEAQETDAWAESGTENNILNLVEIVVLLMLVVAAVGIFSNKRGR